MTQASRSPSDRALSTLPYDRRGVSKDGKATAKIVRDREDMLNPDPPQFVKVTGGGSVKYLMVTRESRYC